MAAADKTFGVKVSEELHDKVYAMIEASGMNNKEWFEKAIAFMEMQSIKQGATDYSQDLNELEIHTTRIYELVSSMVQRSIYIKDHAVKEVSDKLEQTEAVIGEYQEKTKAATEELKETKALLQLTKKENEELTKQLEESRSTNENIQLLINEYKEKNDTLSGLVNEYKGYADENKQLREEFGQTKNSLESQVKELYGQTKDQEKEIEKLHEQIESLIASHTVELERLAEKVDYEKSKALLELEREHQQKLVQSNEEYNNRIKEMYEELNVNRKEYESKINKLEQGNTKLQQELSRIKNPKKS